MEKLVDRELPQEAGQLPPGRDCGDSGNTPQGRTLVQFFKHIKDLLREKYSEEDDPQHESGARHGRHALASQLLLDWSGVENFKYLAQ